MTKFVLSGDQEVDILLHERYGRVTRKEVEDGRHFQKGTLPDSKELMMSNRNGWSLDTVAATNCCPVHVLRIYHCVSVSKKISPAVLF